MTYGVLMCDLTGSKEMSPEQRRAAANHIRAAVGRLCERFPCVVGKAFEFRFGDEWQVLIDSPEKVYTVYTHLYYLLDPLHFYCGIGIGALSLPPTDNTHEVDGPAFHLARVALLDAKGKKQLPVQFRLPEDPRAGLATQVLQSLVAMVSRLRQGRRGSQRQVSSIAWLEALPLAEIAQRLDITRSAVSYRMRSAGVREEHHAIEAVEDLVRWFLHDAGACRIQIV